MNILLKNTGYIKNGLIYTIQSNPLTVPPTTIGQIMEQNPVDQKYFINNETKFKYLKSSKREERIKSNGFKYHYTEGGMAYPDSIDLPARTMLTSESSVNRSTHVIPDYVTGRNRLITPIEAERFNGFPDNWTNTGMTEKRRYFMMGNALVCGIPQLLSIRLNEIINLEP